MKGDYFMENRINQVLTLENGQKLLILHQAIYNNENYYVCNGVLGLSDKIKFKKEDCCSLTFQDNSFDAITVAFGIRNFENLDKGLEEMCRVLKSDGHLVILELSEPEMFPMKQLYSIYSKIVIPSIGKLLSKDDNAYTYLPESIKAFPQGEVMSKIIEKAGFKKVEFKRLTFGICTLYMASKQSK